MAPPLGAEPACRRIPGGRRGPGAQGAAGASDRGLDVSGTVGLCGVRGDPEALEARTARSERTRHRAPLPFNDRNAASGCGEVPDGAGFAKQCPSRRCEGDPRLFRSLRDHPWGPRAERAARLVVGGPGRCTRYGAMAGQGGHGSDTWRMLLNPDLSRRNRLDIRLQCVRLRNRDSTPPDPRDRGCGRDAGQPLAWPPAGPPLETNHWPGVERTSRGRTPAWRACASRVSL